MPFVTKQEKQASSTSKAAGLAQEGDASLGLVLHSGGQEGSLEDKAAPLGAYGGVGLGLPATSRPCLLQSQDLHINGSSSLD